MPAVKNRKKLPASRLVPAAWVLFVAKLEPTSFDYRTRDLSNLLCTKIEHVRHYCNELWPAWEGQYLMDFDQAAVLIYRICRSARRTPARDETARVELFNQLLDSGVIEPDFPRGDPRIERAIKAIEKYRQEYPAKNQL